MNIGIDLGTTYSVAAYVDENENAKVIPNSDGDYSTPSVVLFDDDEIVVGKEAKESFVLWPQKVRRDVKRSMGKNKVIIENNGTKYTPEAVSALIIQKIVQDAEEALGEEVTGVVITVPAYFKDAKRKATQQAAEMAGVNLITMINEPTAAAITYVKAHDIRNEKIMIYDLGGGTFDVTILHVNEQQKMRVICSGGVNEAGGRLFDQKIIDYVVQYMIDNHDIDLLDDEYQDDLQELTNNAEDAKIRLSKRKSVPINMKIGDVKAQITITKEQFEEFIQAIYLRTENKIGEVLKDGGLEKSDIDRILMVGGSSRIPYIREKIAEYMGMEPSKDIHPDEAVALGAAIACKLHEENPDYFVDACSHSIGVAVTNDDGRLENEIIIPKNSSLPVAGEKVFGAMADGQRKFEITITEGEDIEIENVTEIGTVMVNIPGEIAVRKHEPVVIEINLDETQLVYIKIKLPDHDFEENHYLKRKANLEEEQVIEYTGILKNLKVR